MPTWTDQSCAPEIIANAIRAEMGYEKDDSGYESIFDGTMNWHSTAVASSQLYALFYQEARE